MLDVGCWMLDVGRWTLDVGRWMLLDAAGCCCWMLDVGCTAPWHAPARGTRNMSCCVANQILVVSFFFSSNRSQIQIQNQKQSAPGVKPAVIAMQFSSSPQCFTLSATSTERAPEVHGGPHGGPRCTVGPFRFVKHVNCENLGFSQIMTRFAARTAVPQKFRKTAAGGRFSFLEKRN
jgi:hypothetical protein